MFDAIARFIRDLYGNEDFISLHQPVFLGNEKKYLNNCIDTTFVSTVGPYVEEFEKKIAHYTGAKHAISTVNGTAALHIALLVAGVKPGDEVLTQALTFVATANAISYCGAHPVLIDSTKENLGLSPDRLKDFLEKNCTTSQGKLINKKTGRRIAALVPMHVFGHPVFIKELIAICNKFEIPVIEDAAEALGSKLDGQHLGHMGLMGTLSFNGNKPLTTGGGGMVLTNDSVLAKRLKHLTTTARLPHAWEFIHDEVGYNYRLPNINAALGCAQMEYLEQIIENKRETAQLYKNFFATQDINFFSEPTGAHSNYWLNAILFKDRSQRDQFLQYTADNKIMTRPVWRLVNELPMYASCESTGLEVANDFRNRLVNIPSSYRSKKWSQ